MAVTSLRIPDDLHEPLDKTARELQRSKNWIINQALRDYLKRREVEKQRWVETLASLESVKAGRLIDGDEVDTWMESWGTDNEKPAPIS